MDEPQQQIRSWRCRCGFVNLNTTYSQQHTPRAHVVTHCDPKHRHIVPCFTLGSHYQIWSHNLMRSSCSDKALTPSHISVQIFCRSVLIPKTIADYHDYCVTSISNCVNILWIQDYFKRWISGSWPSVYTYIKPICIIVYHATSLYMHHLKSKLNISCNAKYLSNSICSTHVFWCSHLYDVVAKYSTNIPLPTTNLKKLAPVGFPRGSMVAVDINPLNPHDASKHHFTSRKNDLISYT